MREPDSYSPQDPQWDNTTAKDWPEQCEEVEIPSSVDGKNQAAYIYKSSGNQPRPLLISLHTWSFNYQQEDPLSWLAIAKNLNYIHPDFRGVNNTSEACGSPLVSSDIDDAIDYSIETCNVDGNNIHIIGVSGGGHAALLAYMTSRHSIKSYSAWAPITNFVDWFRETEARKTKYAKHIAQATTGLSFEHEPYYLGEDEARKRSLVNMPTPTLQRRDSKLHIYAGIHDGYTGSVPITHSLNMYNKLIRDFDCDEKQALVSASDIVELLSSRSFSKPSQSILGDRKIHYQKNYKDCLQLTVFEGGHELLVDVALSHIDY